MSTRRPSGGVVTGRSAGSPQRSGDGLVRGVYRLQRSAAPGPSFRAVRGTPPPRRTVWRSPGVTVGATLGWPAVTVMGFLVLTCVVIALGTSSTARYEFEHN